MSKTWGCATIRAASFPILYLRLRQLLLVPVSDHRSTRCQNAAGSTDLYAKTAASRTNASSVPKVEKKHDRSRPTPRTTPTTLSGIIWDRLRSIGLGSGDGPIMIASRFDASSLERGNGFVLVSSESEERSRFTYLRAGTAAPGSRQFVGIGSP